MKSEIIAVGSEMLTPWRRTPTPFTSQKAQPDRRHRCLQDHRRRPQEDLVYAIRTALGRVDILAIMGGLGPTEDDLTREAVAEALGSTSAVTLAQVAALHARAAQWRIPMPSNNLKQADVIEGAIILPNPNGSAPGQWLDTTFYGYRKLILLVPGPPSSASRSLTPNVCPASARSFPRAHGRRTLRAAMIPESQADKILAPIYTQYKDVETTILAHAGDIQLTLICTKPNPEAAQARVDELAGRMEEALEDWLYSSGGESARADRPLLPRPPPGHARRRRKLHRRPHRRAHHRRPRQPRAASSAEPSSTPTRSRPPSPKSPLELILQHGAVSAEVAEALANGIRVRTGATIGLGVTGIAGPTGATETKPVGLVYIAVSDAQKTEIIERNFRGDRQRVREWAAHQALDLIRKRLM